MADDVARLIMEVEALRAELRLLARQGGTPSVTGGQSVSSSAAVGALGLHAMTAQGFVSGLTGNGIVSESIRKANPALYNWKNKEQLTRIAGIRSTIEEQEDMYAHRGRYKKSKIEFPLKYKTIKEIEFRNEIAKLNSNYISGMDNYGRNLFLEEVQIKARGTLLYDNIKAQNKEMHRLAAERSFWGQKVKQRFTKPAFALGAIAGGLEFLNSLGSDDNRPRYLTEAEKEAGITWEERFGKVNTAGDRVLAGLGAFAQTTGKWVAMGMVADGLKGGHFAKAKMYYEGAKASFFNPNPRVLPNTLQRTAKMARAFGMGAVRAFGPAALVSAALSIGETFVEENEFAKERDKSDKKLISQINEVYSTDKWTAMQKIDSELLRRGHISAGKHTGEWMGKQFLHMYSKIITLGFFSTKSPSQLEDELRNKMSEDFKQASKHAGEAQKHAELGNVLKAYEYTKKARDTAGDLAPAIWQDPIRWHTMQEQAQRGKICFARWLNNRVSNRTGD